MYQLPNGIAVTSTKARSAKGEISEISGEVKLNATKAVPTPERDLIPIPRNVDGWKLQFSMDSFGLAMIARKERSVQTIDHHNLGLVPADGDDVAQLAIVQALAIRAVAQIKNLDLEDTDERVEARAYAVATLDPTPLEDLQTELAELTAPRYEFTKSGDFRKTSYQRTTEQLESFIAHKFEGAELAQFTDIMAKVVITNGEALRERHHVHKRLNAEAMGMVRGMNQFGRRVDADTSELVAELDESGNLFTLYGVEESPEERRRAMLAYALGNKVKRGEYANQGLLLLLDLSGYKLAMKNGKVKFTKDGLAKLTKADRPWTVAELEEEHGWQFFQKAKRDATAFMASISKLPRFAY